MYCKNCGKQINNNAKFCIYCGSKINATSDNTVLSKNMSDILESDHIEKTSIKKNHRKYVAVIMLLALVAGGVVCYIFADDIIGQFDLPHKEQTENISQETELPQLPQPMASEYTTTKASFEQTVSDVSKINAEIFKELTDNTEQDLKKLAYQAYYDKLIELMGRYGQCDNVVIPVYDDPVTEENLYLKGLCFAKLLDFDGNGLEELLLAYRDPSTNSDEDFGQNYVVEVWSYANKSIEKVYEGVPAGNPSHGQGVEVVKGDRGIYYLFQYKEEDALSEWRELKDGQFQLIRTSKWTENGYEIDGENVSEETWEVEKEKWYSLDMQITYGLQNCGDLCKDSVSALNDTFETLCMYLGMEWTASIAYHENSLETDKSLWGEKLTGIWQALEYESFAEWAELHMYADSTVCLHERNSLYWGIYNIDADGSIYLYLNKSLLYNNADGELNEYETNICVHLTAGEDAAHMYLKEEYDQLGNHNVKSLIGLTRVGDLPKQSSVGEEVQEYRDRILNN